MKALFGTLLILSCIFSGLSPVQAQERSLEERVKALEEKSAAPTEESDELTQLRLERSLPQPLGPGFTGLGPAASKVYTSREPFVLGGMAEAIYRAPSAGGRTTNLSRTDIFAGARLSKNIIFNSSLSFADQDPALPTPQNPATRVTYAYVDFLFREETGIRAGHVLIPFGVTNLKFEPTMYPTVRRPRAEELLIPTSWHENGIIGFWRHGGLLFQTGVVNSGDITTADSATWIRGGRQFGANARAESAAWVARIETVSKVPESGMPLPGVGASLYAGSWAHGDSRIGGSHVMLAEAHAGAQFLDRFLVHALWVEGRLTDTDKIFAVTGKALGEETRGGTFTLSYDLLPPLARRANEALDRQATPVVFRELPVFISYEFVKNQAKLASGLPSDPLGDVRVWTAGINYRPHEQVIIKTNFAVERDGADNESRGFEAAIGITF